MIEILFLLPLSGGVCHRQSASTIQYYDERYLLFAGYIYFRYRDDGRTARPLAENTCFYCAKAERDGHISNTNC